MQNEHAPSPSEQTPQPEREQSHELPKPVFDLEQLTPEQTADLIAAVGARADKEVEPIAGKVGLDWLIERDLKNLATRNIDKANELFATLIDYPDAWVRAFAIDMAPELLRLQPGDTDARHHLTERWVRLLDATGEVGEENAKGSGGDSSVREAAREVMSSVVYADWLDEPTARYFDSKLPLAFKSGKW
ncbi:MAG TPA: hypothetical protein VHX38_41225 [Pseudonocardiaceae bacterium]|jgi:hypothetical protein|nr:hypothetical protein [Pseudonocardiaceae bacterium]